MDRNRRAFLSTVGTASLLMAAGCSTTGERTSPTEESDSPSDLKAAVEPQREVVQSVDCTAYDTDGIFRLETTGTHAISKSEDLAAEIKSHVSQSASESSVNVEIEKFEAGSTTFFVVKVPPNVSSARDLRAEFFESSEFVAARAGQPIRSVTAYFDQLAAWLQSQTLHEESTSRVGWPEPPEPIEATATIDGVSQMTDVVGEDLIQGRVPMDGGEETVFSTADLSSITSPPNLERGLTVFFSFSTAAQTRVLERLRETNVITDSEKGDNDLHFYVAGTDVGAPRILPEAIEGWNENGRIRAMGAPIEIEGARRFYDRFPHLDVMGSNGTIEAKFEIELCD
ncbi:hypothetical protein [Halodesulfurarchaeum formicicum]|uniref:Uncharacterized protein n=1 Tax=Halodesulfurarchaeum formicicum TaxID=1873524 RepID=A0A1J1A8U6_9EURY|nr:hypothetical protein [Halodesulfurarchaeum formicicum]APE94538.1 hypothetical protein HSR6_0062 [Halodesulfurarchaeum formicicum]